MVATDPVATTFRSPFADIDIPEKPLASFVLSRAQELGSKPALIEASSGRQVTYAQLADGVRRAAFGLHRRGFTRGDVLALFTPNVPEFAVAYYAVASLGGTLTTVNPLATADELATHLADSGARWMITVPLCLETALRARGKLEVERIFVLHHGLSKGATLIVMPRFELEPFLAVLERYAVSCAYLVPPVVLALAKDPLFEQCDLSSLRTIICAAAPLDAELARACEQRIDCEIRQAYGLTECSPITHFVPEGRNKPGSVGPVVRNTEAKLVDVSSGEALGPGARGETCIRGPQIMRGYLHRPEATAAMIDPDGWLHSGDIGYADDDGYFYIVDRVKELIKYKGYQVAPAELEAVLLAHPSVIDAAVVGSPDGEAGEVPKAFLVVDSDHAQVDDILAFVAERVAPYKKLRQWEIVSQIPKTASGNILRRRLAEQERARVASSAARTGGQHVPVP